MAHNEIKEPVVVVLPGGYDVVLVSVMPRKYKCPFCNLLMRAPIQTYRGEMACESCYTNAVTTSNGICPIDGEEIEVQNGEIFFKDNHARREVLQLQCYCIYKKNNCEWVGVVNEVENHSITCEYKQISCIQCGELILAKDEQQHMTEECRLRKIACRYCSGTYDAQSVQEHEQGCHMKPMSCPYNCGNSIVMEHLYQHVEACPKIKSGGICPYSVVGCRFNASNSSELADHMIADGQKHAAYTIALVTTLNQTNEKMRQDLLSEQNVRAEMAKTMDEQAREHSALSTEIQKVKESLYNVQQEGKALVDRCTASETTLKGDMEAIELKLQQEDLQGIERKVNEIKQKYDEVDQKMRSGALGGGAGGSRGGAGGVSTDEMKQVNDKINQLERGSAVLSANLSDLELKLQLFENTSYDGRQLWKVDNVMYRMQQAVTGKVTALHSAPCFQKMGGYKFCTRLYLNGDGMGRGTHVSLFFVVMKSEYDALLQWPFSERVTFRLINPYNKEESLKESFIPDKNSSSFKRPQKDMNIAAGCPMFLRKDKLPQFIMDDVIYIECSIGSEAATN